MEAVAGLHKADLAPAVKARRTWVRRALRHRSFCVGGVVVLMLIFLAVLAPLITPHPPGALDPRGILNSPSSTNLFGTDQYGRDVFSRAIYGTRISLVIGTAVLVATGLLGTIIGLSAGYIRQLDNLLMRAMDILMAFPAFLLAIGIMAILGPRISNVVLALTIVYTPLAARVVRGTVLQVREEQYIEAAHSIGAGSFRILVRHILPNCVAPLIVQLSVIFAMAVLAEASLSFIGAGVQPGVSSWGIILSEGRAYLQTAPWIALYGGLAITITVLAVNLLGDGLRDVFDPRMNN